GLKESAEPSVSRTEHGKCFDALQMMREGPSEPAFRRRFQTTFMLLSLRDLVVSDKGKGPEVKG
ncbi:MAG: hypothetical protein KAS29_00750, partial [Bacteroidales bacterium]|nr:hypothetical protein [Bacteroidales bacterium]